MPQPPRKIDVILAEYRSVRDEIMQLNGQLFTVIGSSLTLNVAVLGWLFARDEPAEFFGFPTVRIFILFVGNSILLNRNRVAHRLALFQKYFIETRLPAICWGRVYFEYRKYYQGGRFGPWAERLADSGTYVLFSASVINLVILLYFGFSPLFESSPTQIDWFQSINFVVAAAFVGAQDCFRRYMTHYGPVGSSDASRCSFERANKGAKLTFLQ